VKKVQVITQLAGYLIIIRLFICQLGFIVFQNASGILNLRRS